MNKKLEKFVTPKGVAVYPRLSEPDTKYKPNGEFSCKVRLSAEDSEALTLKIQGIADEFFKETVKRLASDTNPSSKGKSIAASKAVKRASLPIKACVDDDGNETGEYEFNIKMNHKIVTRASNETIMLYPKLFDASKPPKKIAYGTPIYGGSIVKVAGEFNPFYTQQVGVGVQLRMNAVQVIELVQGGSSTGDSFGFGGEEGGYVAEDITHPTLAAKIEDTKYPLHEIEANEF